MGYEMRPPGKSPAAAALLFNRNLVMDAFQVDPLALANDPGDDVDDDGDEVGGNEVVDRVRRRLEGSAVEVVGVEGPLPEHEKQEQACDHADDRDDRDPG